MYSCVAKKIFLIILTHLKLSRGNLRQSSDLSDPTTQWMIGLEHVQREQPSHCREQYDKGSCKLSQWRWAYVSESNKCAQVPYSGCGANGNIFNDQRSCEDTCLVIITPEACRLPMDYGTCKKKQRQFFFEHGINQCVEFKYSGCGGNSNRFKNRAQCEKSCRQWVRPEDVNPQPSETKVNGWWDDLPHMIRQQPSSCGEWFDSGSCDKSKWKYGYISGSNVCGKFPYSGCGGNENMFPDDRKCNEKCVITVAPEICRKPMDYGSCAKKETQFYYIQDTNQCTSFKYSGCGGNSNRFRKKKECEEKCMQWVRPSAIEEFQDRKKLSMSLKKSETDVAWPLGVVPYYIDENDYDGVAIDVVRSALNFLESVSCIKFKHLTDKPAGGLSRFSWIQFSNPSKIKTCVHQPVIEGGAVSVVLGYDCLQRNELLHTILHGLGLKDEVTNPQRDHYVRILWDNIHPENRYLFHLDNGNETNVEYDPLSVMHFHERAFSRNGQPTITPLLPGLQIKPSKQLSQLDQMKLHLIFGHECKKRDVGDLLKSCKKAFRSLQNNTNENQDEKESNEEINKNQSDENKNENNEVTGSREDNPSLQSNTNKIPVNEDMEYKENEASSEVVTNAEEIAQPVKRQNDKLNEDSEDKDNEASSTIVTNAEEIAQPVELQNDKPAITKLKNIEKHGEGISIDYIDE